jgi:hypothetical protein
MSILGVDENWQRAIKGIVLLVAVLLDVSAQKNRGGGSSGFLGGIFKPKGGVQAGAGSAAPGENLSADTGAGDAEKANTASGQSGQ